MFLLLPSLFGCQRQLYRNRPAAIGPRDPAQIAGLQRPLRHVPGAGNGPWLFEKLNNGLLDEAALSIPNRKSVFNAECKGFKNNQVVACRSDS